MLWSQGRPAPALLYDCPSRQDIRSYCFRPSHSLSHPHCKKNPPANAGHFSSVNGFKEHAGISDEVIEAADDFLMIPMCGMVESLNVSASAAILIYMLSERIRQSVDGWQLSDSEQLKLLTRWTMSSVRDYERILRRAEESGKLVVNE